MEKPRVRHVAINVADREKPRSTDKRVFKWKKNTAVYP
jgi:hypothetical protein